MVPKVPNVWWEWCVSGNVPVKWEVLCRQRQLFVRTRHANRACLQAKSTWLSWQNGSVGVRLYKTPGTGAEQLTQNPAAECERRRRRELAATLG